MRNENHSIPRLPIQLLELFLPEEVREDIVGDLYEEFANSEDSFSKKRLQLWYQSLSTLGLYLMTTKNLIKSSLMAVSAVIFIVLTVAIVFLSNADNEVIYAQSYWTNGQIHQFFSEPSFWQYFGQIPEHISINMFIHIPSIIWSCLCIGLLVTLQKHQWFTAKACLFIALVMLLGPYMYGVVTFQMNEIPLRESGPIIAFMWLSVWYLVFPLSYFLGKNLNQRPALV